MIIRLQQITEYISEIGGVEITEAFTEQEGVIKGSVSVSEGEVKLTFNVIITPQYPFQFHNVETIRFINKELIVYNHVNRDGSICVNTLHSPELKNKISLDFDSLKQWIKKYYITKESDTHYEHIVVPIGNYNNTNICFLFTKVNYQFKKGDFGLIKYSFLSIGTHEAKKINTYIIQSFKAEKQIITCDWNSFYKNLPTGEGIYLYIEKPPVKDKRFIIENWVDLEPYVDQGFMFFLYERKKNISKKNSSVPVPLIIGYEIPGNEIHWQCAAIDANNFPNYSEKILGTKIYAGHFYDEQINWLQTKNCSYNYFFGRGALNKKLTEGKILIIGVGAIGSTLATILTRGGCRHLSLFDYDIKEPENICRAEYSFLTGLNSKVTDLGRHLLEISPFVEIVPSEFFTDGIKAFINTGKYNKEIKQKLEEFDYIFDCSTDDDLAFIIDSFHLKSTVINLSITNYAQELICVVSPELYKWMNDIYARLNVKSNDLYNPTGCWSPTFKASYNDVALMVQYTIKQINQTFESNGSLRNFYLQVDKSNGINIKLHQF